MRLRIVSPLPPQEVLGPRLALSPSATTPCFGYALGSAESPLFGADDFDHGMRRWETTDPVKPCREIAEVPAADLERTGRVQRPEVDAGSRRDIRFPRAVGSLVG